MQIKMMKCKTALSASSLPGLDYSLNPYKGCGHQCSYCYAPNILRIPNTTWNSFVEVKENIPRILAQELKKKKPGVVGISTVTDPYQPIEKKFKLTRYCLEQLLRYDFSISIQTKSSLVIRDKDLISQFSNAEVMMSIATLNDTERKLLEPYSSSIKERLNVLAEYRDTDVKTSVFLGPIYPTITLEDIPQLLNIFQKYCVSEVMIDNFHLKEGIWSNITQRLSDQDELYTIFTKRILDKKEHYQKIRNEIHKLGKEKNILIKDAF